MLELESGRVRVRDQVRKQVGRAAVEDGVLPRCRDALDRTFELPLEVLERRHLGTISGWALQTCARDGSSSRTPLPWETDVAAGHALSLGRDVDVGLIRSTVEMGEDPARPSGDGGVARAPVRSDRVEL